MRRVFAPVRPAHTHRPFLHHGQLHQASVGFLQHGNGLRHGEAAALNRDQRALHARRQHDFVQNRLCFLHRAQHVAPGQLVAGFGHGGKLPQLFPVQRGHFYPAGQVVAAAFFTNGLQRALNAIVNGLDQARAQLYRQRGAGGDHFRAGAKAGCLFIYLDRGVTACHIQNFSDKALLAHTDNIGHIGLFHPRSHHQRPGDLYDLSHRLFTFFLTHAYRRFSGRRNAPAQAVEPAAKLPAAGINFVRPAGRCSANLALSQNICAHSPLYGCFDIGHANAQAALFARDQNDSRGELALIAGQLWPKLCGQLFCEV